MGVSMKGCETDAGEATTGAVEALAAVAVDNKNCGSGTLCLVSNSDNLSLDSLPKKLHK